MSDESVVAETTGVSMFSYAKHLNPDSQFFDNAAAEDPEAQNKVTERKLYAWGETLTDLQSKIGSSRSRILIAMVALILSLAVSGLALTRVGQQSGASAVDSPPSENAA